MTTRWGVAQRPTLSGLGARVKIVWGHDPHCKHRDLRDGAETPEYEGTEAPPPFTHRRAV